MDPITSALAGLGPWGVVLGIGLTLAGQFLRNRLSTPAAPPANPTPANPAPAPSGTPILDAVLGLIRSKLLPAAPAQAQPAASDIDHQTAADVLAKLFPPAK